MTIKTSVSINPNKSTIPSLTGLRAVAAYMVYFFHVPVTWLVTKEFDFQNELHIGVPIFFVLSGFLIAYNYQDNYQLTRSWLLTYFIKRAARIFPVYLLILIPTLMFFTHHADLEAWILNVTLLKGLFPQYSFTAISPSWSLTVEECFYTIAPLLFLAIDRKKTFFPTIAVFLLVLALILISTRIQPMAVFGDNATYILLFTFFGRFFEFIIGIWLANFLRGEHNVVLSNRLKISGILTYIGAAGILLCLYIFIQLRLTGNHHAGIYHPAGILVNNIVLPLFIASLLGGLILEKTLLSQLLGTRLFQLLGKSSYAFYIIHIGFIQNWLVKYGWQPINFFILIGVSILIYLIVERPCQRFLTSRSFIPPRNISPKANL